jgi:hypothetical protein
MPDERVDIADYPDMISIHLANHPRDLRARAQAATMQGADREAGRSPSPPTDAQLGDHQ